MTLTQMLRLGRVVLLRNPEGAGGGAGDPPPATPPATPPAAGDPPPATPPATPPAGDANKPWYEQRQWADPALQQHLIKSGYHAGTAEEALDKALKGEIAAVSRLGKPPGSLLDAPKEGQSAAEWMKANARAFGVPETVDKYELKLPENLPAGTPIDDALLSDYRKFAHEAGIPPALAQANVEAYANIMGPRFAKMAQDASAAEAKFNTDLQAAWGPNYKTNQEQAVRAFQALAAEMKLAPEQAKLLSGKLNEGMGDATLMKFFHHIAGKMGEDTLAIPRGGNAPTLQLADAQQRKEQIMARHSGDMAKAVAAGDSARVKQLREELGGLNTVIAQHS